MRKQKTAYEFTMPKMTNDLYILRRVVIDEIYRIKKTYSKLPRLEVRIVNPPKHTNVLGYAWFSSNIIHISSEYVNNPHMSEIVAHEIVHAVTGFNHDEDCPLMSSCVSHKAIGHDIIDSCLEKYLSEYK